MYGVHIFSVHISQLMLSSNCDTSWRVRGNINGVRPTIKRHTTMRFLLLVVMEAFSRLFSSTTCAKSRPITSALSIAASNSFLATCKFQPARSYFTLEVRAMNHAPFAPASTSSSKLQPPNPNPSQTSSKGSGVSGHPPRLSTLFQEHRHRRRRVVVLCACCELCHLSHRMKTCGLAPRHPRL